MIVVLQYRDWDGGYHGDAPEKSQKTSQKSHRKRHRKTGMS